MIVVEVGVKTECKIYLHHHHQTSETTHPTLCVLYKMAVDELGMQMVDLQGGQTSK
jgi:hypothetical protein